MRPLVLFLLFALAITHTHAQEMADSVVQTVSSSIGELPLDRLQKAQRAIQLPDSLKSLFLQADSLRSSFVSQSTALKHEYDSAVGQLDLQTAKLNRAIVSLENLQLPIAKLAKKQDSLHSAAENIKSKLSEKSARLKAKTTDKLKSLDLPPQYQEPIQQLTQSVDGFSLDADLPVIEELKLPGYDLPKFDGIVGDLSLKGGIPGVGNLQSIETPVGDLGNIGEQVKRYQSDIKNITGGNLNDVKQLPETIEARASEIAGIDELQKHGSEIDALQNKVDGLEDPEAAKKRAAEMAKKVAVDHFAGKEEQLKAAMDKVAKYKRKYASAPRIGDLPKRLPNGMKGKPFRDRFIPGLYFQYQQRDNRLFDLNPYGSYLLSGRFTVGAGWNERVAYGGNGSGRDKQDRIWGPRAFVDFKLGKGFIAHLEGECMNSFVPLSLIGNRDDGQREWVLGSMLGLKKEYKIHGNLKGTILLQYNLIDRKHRSPYVTDLNSRIGFEYSLKKRKKKTSKAKARGGDI